MPPPTTRPRAAAALTALLAAATLPAAAQTTLTLNPGDRVADNTAIADGTTVNVNGGSIGLGVDLSNGVLNINGGSVALDGTPVDNLTLGQALTVDTRNVTLTATLADGSFFETDLNPAFGGFFSANPDGAAANATITLTLVPEPTTLLSLAGAATLLIRRRRPA